MAGAGVAMTGGPAGAAGVAVEVVDCYAMTGGGGRGGGGGGGGGGLLPRGDAVVGDSRWMSHAPSALLWLLVVVLGAGLVGE